MLPRADLPDLLLEVHAWTGFLDAYTHLADAAARAKDLPVSVAALLVAEACNVGADACSEARGPALGRDRLAHVDQYYVRADTHAAANAVLIGAQAQIPIAQAWGGGLLASVNGAHGKRLRRELICIAARVTHHARRAEVHPALEDLHGTFGNAWRALDALLCAASP